MELSADKDVPMKGDRDAIRQAIFNIINTVKGSRPINPDFGCNLNIYLFEPYNEETAMKIGKDIERNIGAEPRIIPLSIDITLDDENSGYVISVVYSIKATQTRDAINFRLQAL
jgi:phage baseplate assembly protein W